MRYEIEGVVIIYDGISITIQRDQNWIHIPVDQAPVLAAIFKRIENDLQRRH